MAQARLEAPPGSVTSHRSASQSTPHTRTRRRRKPDSYDSLLHGRPEPDENAPDFVGFDRSPIWHLYDDKFTYVPTPVARVVKTKTEMALVSQLYYWLTRRKGPRPQVNCGCPWVYRSYKAWARELYATTAQVEAAARALARRGLIWKEQFSWERPLHYSINWEEFEDAEVTRTDGTVEGTFVGRGVGVRLWTDLIAQTHAETLVLAQVDYWFGRGDAERVPTGVHRDGHHWVYKTRGRLGSETGLTKLQVLGALRALTKRGLLVKQAYPTKTGPMPHFRIDPIVVEDCIGRVHQELEATL